MRYYTLRKASYPNTATSSRDFLALRPTRVTIESFILAQSIFFPLLDHSNYILSYEKHYSISQDLTALKRGFQAVFPFIDHQMDKGYVPP